MALELSNVLNPRGYLLEFLQTFVETLGVCKKTKDKYREGDIQDCKLPNVCLALCQAIGGNFTSPARHALHRLMIAWFTTMPDARRKLLMELKQDIHILRHAFEAAVRTNPKDAIGFGTTLGLAALWESLVATNVELKRNYAAEAIRYWQRVWDVAEESGNPLQGYLRHRILVWFAIADFNAVDKTVHEDVKIRDELIAKWKRNDVLGEIDKLIELLPGDFGPVFVRAIFATVMREWAIAGKALLEIEERAASDTTTYFQIRRDEFYKEPIVAAEFAKIRTAAKEIKAPKEEKAIPLVAWR